MTARLAELAEEQGVVLKELAALLPRPDGKGTKTAALVGAALRGESNLLVGDAEKIAPRLGASIEVVIHDDPVDEFRRALAANDLTEEWRDTIWSAFQQAKAQALTRGTKVGPRPKKVRAG